jgi:alpha-1,2-mannosyltransferase
MIRDAGRASCTRGIVSYDAAIMARWHLRLTLFSVFLITVGMHAWDLCTPGLLDRTGRLKGPDFLQFYTYASLVRDGLTDRLYDPAAHAEMMRTRVDARMTLKAFRPNYSPVIAWLMTPFARLAFLPALAVWSLASVVLYGLAIAVIARCTENLRTDRITTAIASAAFPAVFVVLRYGQLSALTLALLAAAVWLSFRWHPLAAGFAFGLIVYKPNLLIVPILALALAREWRLLGGIAAASIGESTAGLALAGWSSVLEYWHILTAIALNPDVVQAYPTESHSARGFVRLLTPWTPALIGTTVVALALSSWAVATVWRRSSDWRPRWAALTLGMLIATPHLLTYDLLLLAIPLMLTADWLLSGSSSRGGVWCIALALLYGSAWPGTLIARLYGFQLSTVGMALTLWLLVDAVSRPATSTTAFASASSSSISPIISS